MITNNFAQREVSTAAYDEQQTQLRSIVVDLNHGVSPMNFNEKKRRKNLVTSLFSSERSRWVRSGRVPDPAGFTSTGSLPGIHREIPSVPLTLLLFGDGGYFLLLVKFPSPSCPQSWRAHAVGEYETQMENSDSPSENKRTTFTNTRHINPELKILMHSQQQLKSKDFLWCVENNQPL
jgi:hypothetical protein